MIDLSTAQSQLSYASDSLKKQAWDIVGREGGFANNLSDSGGATNYGVSLRYALGCGRTFDLNGDGKVDVADIRLITAEMAVATFLIDFFLSKGLNAIGEGFKNVAFDTSVNAGPRKAVMLVQRAVNVLRKSSNSLAVQVPVPLVEDGMIGAKSTLASVLADHLVPHAQLINTFCDVRDADYDQIARNNPADQIFLKGWKRRADSFRVIA